MKTIRKIARVELSILFYSPISWLLLIAFAVQTALKFTPLFRSLVDRLNEGHPVNRMTEAFFSDGSLGVLPYVEHNLYLYIPLLTMGLVSRELSSGSIKLLQSSPVKIGEIVLGKFLAIMVYWLILFIILVLYAATTCWLMEETEWRLILAGLLSVILLTGAYSAIGLFMSSLTSYQVVAALGTFSILAILNFVGGMWQSVPFLRDITWFLYIHDRAQEMADGLIVSKDILYFLIMTGLFLGLTFLVLKARTESRPLSFRITRYVVFISGLLLLGYLTSRPLVTGYADATVTRENTLSETSQQIIKNIKGPVTVTAYTNLFSEMADFGLPENRNINLDEWSKYSRFMPNMKLVYVNYYDSIDNSWFYKNEFPGLTQDEIAQKITISRKWYFDELLPPAWIHSIIDLTPLKNESVLQVGDGTRKEFLHQYPEKDLFSGITERNIVTAFKRLDGKAPKIAFLTDHHARSIDRWGDLGYKGLANNFHNRNCLCNMGFDVLTVSVERDLPTDISALVIAEPTTAFSPEEIRRIGKYIDAGGNLLVLGEKDKQDVLNPLLQPMGVHYLEGSLVQNQLTNYTGLVFSTEVSPENVFTHYTESAARVSSRFGDFLKDSAKVLFSGAIGLAYDDTGSFAVNPILMTSAVDAFNKMGEFKLDTGRVSFNPENGDNHSSVPVALALTRQKGIREQRILVLGDADELDNKRLGRNWDFVSEIFKWFSYGQYPLDIRRPILENKTTWLKTRNQAKMAKDIFVWVIPILLLVFGGVFLYWRKRK